ncbi:hypothetical protein Plhal304r1_c064g0151931 [Plasmopara halstedii]
MAKSDFVQGKKLKALIQRESLDDASTDSLANLFQQVMGKNANMEEPTAAEKSFEDFFSGVNDVARKEVNTRAYIKGKKSLRSGG